MERKLDRKQMTLIPLCVPAHRVKQSRYLERGHEIDILSGLHVNLVKFWGPDSEFLWNEAVTDLCAVSKCSGHTVQEERASAVCEMRKRTMSHFHMRQIIIATKRRACLFGHLQR